MGVFLKTDILSLNLTLSVAMRAKCITFNAQLTRNSRIRIWHSVIYSRTIQLYYLVNTEQRFILNRITSTWLHAIPYRTEHETWHRIYDEFFEAFQMFSNNFYRIHTSVQNSATILLRVFIKLTSRSICKSTVHMLYV